MSSYFKDAAVYAFNFCFAENRLIKYISIADYS